MSDVDFLLKEIDRLKEQVQRMATRPLSAGGGGGAPTNATYIVETSDPTLTQERVLTSTATVAWDFSTPGQASASVPNDSITFAKMQNISSQTLIGRESGGVGDPESIMVSNGLTMSGGSLIATAPQRAEVLKIASLRA